VNNPSERPKEDVTEFLVLGPLRAYHGPVEVPLGGPLLRKLLALLLLHANEPVPYDTLTAGLWPTGRPRHEGRALQAHVRGLRALLPGHDIQIASEPGPTGDGGWMLEVGAENIDATRFRRLHAEGLDRVKSGELQVASDIFRQALALWRGPAFDELTHDPFVDSRIERLEELRLTALEDRIDVDLRVGRHAELVDELRKLVIAHPRRERLWGQLMVALDDGGRQVDALRTYRRAMDDSNGFIGSGSSRRLHELEHAVLLQRRTPGLLRIPSLTTVPANVPTRIRPGGTDITTAGPNRPDPDPAPISRGSVAHVPDFVGRTDELRFLSRVLSDVAAGRPAVVMIEGEPGIGKSRLAREVVRDAASLGMTVSVGRCTADSAVPYLPFIDDLFMKLRSAVDDPTVAAHSTVLRDLHGWAAGRIDRHDANDQLVAAVRSSFMALAERTPVVVYVDDAQWADPSSADLLVHLVRTVADSSLSRPVRVLFVLTVRSVETGGGFQQRDALRAEPLTTTLRLQGLSEAEVETLVRQLGLRHAPSHWLHNLVEVTRGNPLFVSGIAREVASTAPASDHVWSSPLRGSLPSEIETMIDATISRLSDECRDFLAPASVVGSFDAEMLLRVLGQVANPGLHSRLLDEAARHGVVERHDTQWQFAHPLYAHACQARLPDHDRQTLHASMATVLLASASTNTDQVSVMATAHHLIEAGAIADPRIVVEVAGAAGERALTLFAWRQAAQFFESALDASERLPETTPQRRVRLLRGAGIAREHSGEPKAALRHLDRAVGLLREGDDPELVSDVWINKLQTEIISVGVNPASDTGPLGQLAIELEVTHPSIAADIHSNLAQYCWVTGQVKAAREHAFRAIGIGSPVGAHGACVQGYLALAVTEWITLDLGESLEHLERGRRHAEASNVLKRHTGPAMRLPLNLVWMGRLAEVDGAVDHAQHLSRNVNYAVENGLVLAAAAMASTARGMFSETDSHVEAALEVERTTGYPWATPLVLPTLAAARAARGDLEGTEAVLECWIPQSGTSLHAVTASLVRIQLQLDRGERWAVERFLTENPIAVEPRWRQFGGDTTAGLLIEVAATLDRPDLAAAAGQLLETLFRQGQLFTTTMAMLLPRLIGTALAVQGDYHAAEGMLETALGTALRLGAHAEAARAGFALARTLWARPPGDGSPAGERVEELIDTAHRLASGLGMVPLARATADFAQSLRGRHPSGDTTQGHPGSASAVEPTIESVVILFTDIADSTGLTEQLGDWLFRERARALENELRETIRTFGGRLVEGITLGDGLLADFGSGPPAVACAVKCQEIAVTRGLPLHVGLHAGEVIREAGNIFGGSVNLAARVCSTAPPGRILVSQRVRDMARNTDESMFDNMFDDLGDVLLKGFAQPVRLFDVHAS
jgi:class 3 adenylate cyclase/DNA-binding SARP family transcriptional activator